MKEPVLKAVAAPPMFFWASYPLAFANFIGQVALMALYLAITSGKGNPIWVLGTMLIGHFFLVLLHKREPHMGTMIRTWGFVHKKTTRLDGEKSNKFSA